MNVKKTLRILCFGKALSLGKSIGTVHGARVVLDGILNAPQCLVICLVIRLIFMVVDRT
ncbi:hypothetical protein D3C75_1042600 [compost metagenome]